MALTGNIILVINVKEDVRAYERDIVAGIRQGMALPADLADLFKDLEAGI